MWKEGDQYRIYFISVWQLTIKMGTGEQAPCFPGNCSATDLYPQPRTVCIEEEHARTILSHDAKI